MSISQWIELREIRGFPTFSFREVADSFPALSENVVANELCRLCKRKRIEAVHKSFYTVIPIQFKDKGTVPPYNYVDQLMAHLGRNYYVCLLSAGVLHGAAHQRPQRLMVMTEYPRITFTERNNKQLFWCYRKEIPQTLLCRTNTDTGTILYSNPELTAVDLVQYNHLIGGLSAATTVIAELAEKTDFRNCGDELVKTTTLPTLQRLGYILDVILENGEQASAIADILQPHRQNLRHRPLTTSAPTKNAIRNSDWKLIINNEIDPDEKVMSEKELNSYRLTSLEEPTDEMLSAIMKEVAEDVKRENEEAMHNLMEQLHAQVAENRKRYGYEC